MTFSFNLVLALFLLAPGFAFVMGVYYGGPRTRLEPTPPPPNSLVALALVTSGALAAHLACAGFYAACELIALWSKASWSLPHPNPYVVALGLNGAADRYREFGLFWALLNLTALSAATFGATRLVIDWRLRKHSRIRGALYGWMSEATISEGAIAYVVTTLELDGAAVGYEGLVEYMTLDSSKQIVSLVLSDCELFTMVAKGGMVHRVRNPREEPLENIVLGREAIRNIAFTPVGAPEDEALASA
ncbi:MULTISPECIES: hypothetical protein [unclassified Caulobacter]|uniref:hypothetical protein n=1 Tax=unclassified Caulobacter TaxID=2648921 RepID=UPI0006F652BC|nr:MULTISPECIES: hypothetical protein [unclassified Caulobacter]KQV58619.1 hypothetical protein ASC62_07475 [Caulobacter sp. Root342]KQV68872.1 hypothetical protein ASC70_08560 [Caulobacter sp. Root343]